MNINFYIYKKKSETKTFQISCADSRVILYPEVGLDEGNDVSDKLKAGCVEDGHQARVNRRFDGHLFDDGHHVLREPSKGKKKKSGSSW